MKLSCNLVHATYMPGHQRHLEFMPYSWYARHCIKAGTWRAARLDAAMQPCSSTAISDECGANCLLLDGPLCAISQVVWLPKYHHISIDLHQAGADGLCIRVSWYRLHIVHHGCSLCETTGQSGHQCMLHTPEAERLQRQAAS